MVIDRLTPLRYHVDHLVVANTPQKCFATAGIIRPGNDPGTTHHLMLLLGCELFIHAAASNEVRDEHQEHEDEKTACQSPALPPRLPML